MGPPDLYPVRQTVGALGLRLASQEKMNWWGFNLWDPPPLGIQCENPSELYETLDVRELVGVTKPEFLTTAIRVPWGGSATACRILYVL